MRPALWLPPLLVVLLIGSLPQRARAELAAPGPIIELPPELPAEVPPSATPDPPAAAVAAEGSGAPLQSPYFIGAQPRRAINSKVFNLARESQIDVSLDPRTAAQRGATVGGYGDATVNVPLDRSAPAIADLAHTVLFFGFNFTDHIRYFSEIEWEHAFTSNEQRGEIAVEQMLIDFTVRRWFNVRAGMSIVPINLVNLYHEPSTFNGVARPDADLYIIPSTWKQLMVGFYGALGTLRYQIYLTPGMRAEGFSAATGLRGGVQGNLPEVHDIGVTGRLDWAPILGTNLGLSGYFARAGQGDPNLDKLSVAVGAFDAQYNRAGLLARAQISYVYIDGVEQLNAVLFRINPAAGPVSRQLLGGYLEVGYDLLHPLRLRSGMQLLAFFRYDRSDTQLDVPVALSGARQPGFDRSAYVAGLTFKPIFEIAVKADYTYRHSEVAGSGTQLLDFALAYQF